MKYIVKRLYFYLIAFLGAITLNFFLPRMMPGNPVQMYIASLYTGGQTISPEIIKSVEKMYGFDTEEPLVVSYVNYIKNICRGDWGTSFSRYPQSVIDAVQRGLKWTVFLMGTALIIGFIINNLLGILVAWKRGGKLDTTLTLGGQILANIPALITALILSYALAYTGHFPRGYATTPLYDAPTKLAYLQDVFKHAFLPLTAVVIGGLTGIMGMRSNMINQLGEDYITMGIAKGVPERKIMFSYGAKNALLPVVTSLAMSVGFLLGGSLIIEEIFNYPGLGHVMVQAISFRDYPLMQGILLMSTILMLTCNFIADISIMFLDPRIRRQGVGNN